MVEYLIRYNLTEAITQAAYTKHVLMIRCQFHLDLEIADDFEAARGNLKLMGANTLFFK